MRYRVCAILWALTSMTGLVVAEDAYTLKLYQPKKGDVSTITKTKTDSGTLTFEFGGMTRKEDLKGEEKFVYTQEILEMKEGVKKPVKLKRTYTTAQKTEKKELVKLPYHGETVLIEKIGDKYEFSINGKKADPADVEDLDKEFNKKVESPTNDELLPEKPVKVGESWSVDTKKAIKSLNADGKMTINEKNSSITGKLLKAEKINGVLMGQLEFTITLGVESMAFGAGDSLEMEKGSKMIMNIVVDAALDGSKIGENVKMAMEMKLSAGLPNNGKIVIDGKSTGGEVVESKK